MNVPNTLPIYPHGVKKQPIPLDSKGWARLAHLILEEEGLPDLPVLLEPGPYNWWWELSFFEKVMWMLRIPAKYMNVGTFLIETEDKTGQVRRAIHIAVNRDKGHILDTIVHEVAHAKASFDASEGHGKKWQEIYRGLRKKYVNGKQIRFTSDMGHYEEVEGKEEAVEWSYSSGKTATTDS